MKLCLPSKHNEPCIVHDSSNPQLLHSRRSAIGLFNNNQEITKAEPRLYLVLMQRQPHQGSGLPLESCCSVAPVNHRDVSSWHSALLSKRNIFILHGQLWSQGPLYMKPKFNVITFRKKGSLFCLPWSITYITSYLINVLKTFPYKPDEYVTKWEHSNSWLCSVWLGWQQ